MTFQFLNPDKVKFYGFKKARYTFNQLKEAPFGTTNEGKSIKESWVVYSLNTSNFCNLFGKESILL